MIKLPTEPNWEEITPEWVQEQMEELGVSPKDLVNQIGQDKSWFSNFINKNRGVSKVARSAIYHFFKRLKRE